MAATTPHYEKGSESKIAVVLSCPGQKEEGAKKPAAGQTGKNLEDVLNILKNTYGLNDFEKGKITITNAWDRVEYKSKSSRSEATDEEILEDNNLNRLADEIKDITDFIICCGDKAKIAVLALQQQGKLNKNCGIIEVPHLGIQGMNKNINEDINGNEIVSYKKSSDKPADENRSLKKIQAASRALRLEVVAREISEQIAKEIYKQIESQTEIKENIKDWIKRVSNLYTDINDWLKPDTLYTTKEKAGVILYEKPMDDNHIQPEQLNILDIYSDNRLIATIKPTGLWLIGSKGRVDILSKKGSVLLVDKAENWLAYPKNEDFPIPFDKNYFLNMLENIKR